MRLSNPDFLGTLLEREQGQSEHPQAGDQDRQYTEMPNDRTKFLIGFVLAVEEIIEEEIVESAFSKHLLIVFLN